MARTRLSRPLLVAPAAGLAAALVTATPALAHTGHPAHGVRDGLVHPVTGIDHLLAMVAVGVIAALAVERGRRWVAPAAFLGGMAIGGALGLAEVALPGAETMIVLSVILLGLGVLASVDLPRRFLGVAMAMIALAGAAHGHAHGAEAPLAANAAAYVAGFLAASAGLVALGAGVGALLRDRRTVRVGMGLTTVAAGALLFLA